MANDLRITVKFDVGPVEHFLTRLQREQIPFATALALTGTAQDAQLEIRTDLPQNFIIRRPWVEKGIRITSAKKRDQPIFAEVGTVDQFMVMQETGGTKLPSGHKSVTVPQGVRASKRQLIPRSKWPGKLAKKRGRRAPFFTIFKSGLPVLAQRVGKKRVPLKVLYSFHRSVQMKERFGFKTTLEEVVGRVWLERTSAALERAVKSARPPR